MKTAFFSALLALASVATAAADGAIVRIQDDDEATSTSPPIEDSRDSRTMFVIGGGTIFGIAVMMMVVLSVCQGGSSELSLHDEDDSESEDIESQHQHQHPQQQQQPQPQQLPSIGDKKVVPMRV